MDVVLFAKSLLLGVAIAAPLGPIGALCVSRTLERGFIMGVAGGLGTALADGTYAALAAFGFSAFSDILARLDQPLRLGGGAFMLWLGWIGLRRRPTQTAAKISARDLLGTTGTTFLLTMANPMTILSFAALFAGLGLASVAGGGAFVLVVGGIFSGSMLWWCLLSGGVAIAKHRLPTSFALWVSRLSAMLMIGFGIWAIGSVYLW